VCSHGPKRAHCRDFLYSVVRRIKGNQVKVYCDLDVSRINVATTLNIVLIVLIVLNQTLPS
jgi:hypothetical protein